ncbi:MAG: 50S ribosomal protein L10 [Planctomycetes bacterium]|nr:50S ribosomal protein L10 [Planctomycetota bacterium]
MPNQVNEILLADLRREFTAMGSCVVVEFGKLKPQQDLEIRGQMRDAGVRYRVVRGRLAVKAFAGLGIDMDAAFSGRCAVAIAKKEGAIQAAKILRDWIKKTKDAPISIKGGVVEGTAYTGALAATIADLPDRNTVNSMLVGALSGPARSLASLVSAVAGGMARCIQARVDQAGGAAGAAPEGGAS